MIFDSFSISFHTIRKSYSFSVYHQSSKWQNIAKNEVSEALVETI